MTASTLGPLALRVPVDGGYMAVVEMAAHIYASAVPGASALGERVEMEVLEAAERVAGDGATALLVTLTVDSQTLRATVRAEGAGGKTVELEWRV